MWPRTVEAKESVEVRSRVRGHILASAFKEGDEIEADKDLFTIDAGPYEAALEKAKGLLKTSESELKLAEEKIKLYSPLVEKGTVSKEDLLKAFADKGKAIGGIGSAKGEIMDAELNIGYCKIKSPIAGRVGEALLSKGDLVNASGADSLLTTIIAVDPMYVYFNVNETKYQEYREILRKDPAYAKADKPKIPVKLFVSGRVEPYEGIIDFVDSRVGSATGSIKVRAKFDNPIEGGLRRLTAGLFARVRISIEKRRPALLVADRAILTDQNLKYVLTVNRKKNEVDRVDISVSERLEEDGRREVLKGLTGDEWIIVDGINRVRPGVTVAPKEEPMPRLVK
jgi:multidrug efflux system membrane fusion protein